MSEQLHLPRGYISKPMHQMRQLLLNQAMVDVTLVCEGATVKAHKMVLSMYSSLMKSLFLNNPCVHPIVILKDVKANELKALINIIYFGKVDSSGIQLLNLKKTAASLGMKELFEAVMENIHSNEHSQQSVSRPDESPSKRRKRRSRKSSLNDKSDDRASHSGNLNSEVEVVDIIKAPLEVAAHETYPPEEELNLPIIPLLEETLQDNISIQEEQSSLQSITEQQRWPQNKSGPSDKSISVPTDSSEIASQLPGYTTDNAPQQDDLMLNLKKAVETLKVKGLLTTADASNQSDDIESTHKESISDCEIINEDSDIEEIIQYDKPQQEPTIDLDDVDDEPILDDVILPNDSSSMSLDQLSKQSIDRDKRTNLPSTSRPMFSSDSIFSSQLQNSPGTSRSKRFSENQNNQSADEFSNGSSALDEPPLKRRRRRRQAASKSTGDLNAVILDIDSDIEVINEPSTSFSTAPSCQSNQKHIDVQVIDEVNAKDNTGLEPNKLLEKNLPTDDGPSYTPAVDSTTPDLESSSAQLDQYSAVLETIDKLLDMVSNEVNGKHEDVISES